MNNDKQCNTQKRKQLFYEKINTFYLLNNLSKLYRNS